jgi:AbrB family looped-hinge helix DNA binding protein
MIKTVSVKGQLVLPSKLRRKYGITSGGTVSIFDTGSGILIEPVNGSRSQSEILVESKIDGGPAVSFERKRVLTSEQVSKLLEESE